MASKTSPQRELIASDNNTKKFLPRNPRPGERILLIDTIIGSGRHLIENGKNIAEFGADVEAAFFLVDNDMYFSEKGESRFDRIGYMNKYQKDVFYLYKMTDLFELRKDELLVELNSVSLQNPL